MKASGEPWKDRLCWIRETIFETPCFFKFLPAHSAQTTMSPSKTDPEAAAEDKGCGVWTRVGIYTSGFGEMER
jgi:hypothetical protein